MATMLLTDGRGLDPGTGEIVERALSRHAVATVLGLRGATAALGTMLSDRGNAAQWRRALGRIDAARGEREALRVRLEQGWRWLETHAADARFANSEDRWFGWLADYTALCDAIRDAEIALCGAERAAAASDAAMRPTTHDRVGMRAEAV